MSNSTFSGNSAANNGGALWNFNTLELRNSTFSGNTATSGGGLYNVGTINTLQNNLFADSSLFNVPPHATNLVGTAATLGLDPILRNNGGPTQTHALLPGSIAINAATSGTTTDQRGIAAVGTRDIGAFESRGFTITTTGGTPQSTPAGSAFTNPLAVSITSAFSEPVAGGTVTYTALGSGASATFSSTTATLNASGAASVIATANNTPGTYSVTAGGNGITTPASFSLTNNNNAPVLNAAATPVLTAINEDAGAPVGAVGTLISSLVDFNPPVAGLNNVADLDTGAVTGIAITAANTTNGTWWYSTNNGTTWSAIVSAVSNTSARLLAADANTRVYFQPTANYNGTVTNALTFRAWDTTTGSNGGTADTSTNGGTTAFSSITDTAAITVNPVNDAPVNTLPATASTNEDTLLVFSTANGNAISIADGDAGSNPLKLTVTATNGTVSLSGIAGLSFTIGDGTADAAMTFTGTLAHINAALNGSGFAPTADYNGTASFTLTTDDQGHSGAGSPLSDTDTITLTVNPVNDAPVLSDTLVNLASVRSSAGAPVGAVGTLVSQLVSFSPSGSGQQNVSDVDTGAQLGIAITTANTANGTWFYSTNNGSSWNTLGAVADTTARLLSADANTRLYFQPNTGFAGSLATAITFRAWDQSSGTNGGWANTTTHGGVTAFSTTTDTAAIQVNNPQSVDFNRDGNADILWANAISGDIGMWAMNGTSLATAAGIAVLSPEWGWMAVAAADFSKDGKTDILFRNYATGDVGIWILDGTMITGYANIGVVDVMSGWDIVGAGDLDGNGDTDILWRNYISGDNGSWSMSGTNPVSYQALPSLPVDSGWLMGGVGDFTNDGVADILLRNYATGTNGIWQMDATGVVGFTEITAMAPNAGWEIASVGDFTQDGRNDILWWNSSSGQMTVWGMNGTTVIGGTNIDPVVPSSSGWYIV